jgi:ABC-type polysaccharide transport system permease subunit
MYLCTPAIVYLLFSIAQVLIDISTEQYDQVILKVISAILVTLLLNIVCSRGYEWIAWIFIFIPFFLMSVVLSIMVYFFGLNVATGETKSMATGMVGTTATTTGTTPPPPPASWY